MFDNRERVYRVCTCGHMVVMVKNWHGPTPRGAIQCPHCYFTLDIGLFRHAFTGARWAARFYASHKAVRQAS